MVRSARNLRTARRGWQGAARQPFGGPLFVGAIALAALLGCKRGDVQRAASPAPLSPAPAPSAPSLAPAPSPPAAAEPPDVRAAAAWIDALRERDPGAVLGKTVLPFDYRDGSAARSNKCGSKLAKTRAAAARIATCVATDARFHAELSATPEPRLVALGASELPPWAQRWARTLPRGVRALSTFVHGETDARELVLLVGDDGVHGLWQNLTIEPK